MKLLGLRWMLVPRWVDASNFSIEGWVMDMCNKAEASLQSEAQLEPEDTPTVSPLDGSALGSIPKQFVL